MAAVATVIGDSKTGTHSRLSLRAHIRYAILGHEEETVADSYDTGFSVPKLKKWIDKIGF